MEQIKKQSDIKAGMWLSWGSSGPVFMAESDGSLYTNGNSYMWGSSFYFRDVAVKTPTKEDYDRLMRAYDAVGWSWCNGNSALKQPYTFKNSTITKVTFKDRFFLATMDDSENMSEDKYHLITVDEAIVSLSLQYFNVDFDFDIGERIHIPQYTDGKTFINKPNQTTMQKLSAWAKRNFSPSQKTLFKAGYIHEDMSPTSRGQEELDAILWQANEKELVQSANEYLKDSKKK